MKAGKMLVKPGDVALKRPSVDVVYPMNRNSKIAIKDIIEFLQRGENCPSVIDSICAPLLGHNLRIVAF